MKHEVKTVFLVDRCGIQEGIAPEFLTVPFIIDEAGKPDSHVNEYFLARRNGDWAAKVTDRGDPTEMHGRTVLRASLTYLRNRAYQLDVHRRWLRSEGLTYATVDEATLDRFAEDLEEGLFTNMEGGLLPSTVNQYLTSVIDFLQYAAEVGWRSPLTLRMRRCRRDGKGGGRRS